MNELAFGKYSFLCELNNQAILPAYKGSTFRGVFGIALKKVVCALKRQECESCLLKRNCLYTRVFETPLALNPRDGLRVSVVPHPFVIEPPAKDQREFNPGDTFEANLLLFGDANNSLPYFIYAFEQMGKIGIGRRIKGQRAEFKLKKVNSNGDTIYSHTDEKINSNDECIDVLKVPSNGKYSEDTFKIHVTLKTPLRLKRSNRLTDELPFHVLVSAMTRRVSSLFTSYADAEPDLDYQGLVQRAKDVVIKDSSLKWHAWERYSNRQKQKVPLGGMAGSITYEGKLGEFLPLLDICSKVHIGKNTAFGLGKIRAKIVT